ncbi:MAG TPA: single-stranded-DNA-specific exonuclease RecJ [Gammaproteobacteria bacterium]
MEIRQRERIAECELPESLHPLLRTVFAQRAIRSSQELHYGLDALIPPDALGNIDAAAELLAAHFDKRILVIGDFDADGATSTAVALLGLRALGAQQVDFLVPDRFRFGYGLTPEIVELALTRKPDLIVTVDNGIASHAGVAAARAHGINVLVTDHHLPGAQLPEADVIVNPNLPGDAFPSKALAGVGVMFYVLLALRKVLRKHGALAKPEPNLAELLDLVALGTVADVVPLDHNNRVLIHQGLQRIRAGKCRPGISALLEIAKRSPAQLAASDLGFAVGPRLNAAGRLENMSIGIECLLADDPASARQLAAKLDELNRDRRGIEQEMKEEAILAVEKLALDADLPLALCLHEAHWHQGVVGIVASRIKDRTHRPVIAFAMDDETGLLKGSARSVAGVHIRDALDAVATRHPGLVEKFGGHAMAAGLSLAADRLAEFSIALNEEIARWISPDELRGVILSDGELAPEFLCLDAAIALRDAGPWGQGFPEPLFDGVFDVRDRRIVGEKHLKLRLAPVGAASVLDGIAFNAAEFPEAPQVRAVFRLDVNEWQGRQSAQLVIEHLLSA